MESAVTEQSSPNNPEPSRENKVTPWKISTFALIIIVIALLTFNYLNSKYRIEPIVNSNIPPKVTQTTNNQPTNIPEPETRMEFSDLPIAKIPEKNALYLGQINGKDVLYSYSDTITLDYGNKSPTTQVGNPDHGSIMPLDNDPILSHSIISFNELSSPRKIVNHLFNYGWISSAAISDDRGSIYVTTGESIPNMTDDEGLPIIGGENILYVIKPGQMNAERILTLGNKINPIDGPKYQGYNGGIDVNKVVGNGKYLILVKNICGECDSLNLATIILNTQTLNETFLGVTLYENVLEADNVVQYRKAEYVYPDCPEGQQCAPEPQSIGETISAPLP